MTRLDQRSVGKRMLFTFGTLCTVLVIIGGFFFFSLRFIERSNELQQSRALKKLALIDDTAQDIGEVQADVLRQIMASDVGEIKELDQTILDLDKTNARELADYQKFVDTGPEKQLYQRVTQTRKAYWEQTLPVLTLSRKNRDAEASAIINTKQAPAYDDLLKAIDELIKYEETDANKAAKTTTRSIAEIRIIGDVLIGVAILIALGTGFAVATFARQLKRDNRLLQIEVTERKQAEEELRGKTAFLEAQVNSSIDGILVVDSQGKRVLHNERLGDLFDIPKELFEDKTDERMLRHVTGQMKDPGQFIERVKHLYEHPEEIGRDELELTKGMFLDRYSAPVRDQAGKYYGRIWTFRDITERTRSDEALRESEERFSGAFEYAPMGMALVAPGGRWLKVNRALCDLVGYPEAELLTRNFQDMTHAEDLDVSLERARLLLAGETRSYQVEKRYIHARGHYVTVLLSTSLVRDGQGQPGYFVAQIQDITERKQAEESLRLLNSAVEQSKESIVITDAELDLPGPKIIFVNPTFTQMTGYAAEEVIGKTPRILQGPHTDRAVLNRLRQTLERGEVFTGTAINYRKDGTEFHLEWQIAPIRNTGGKTTHFVAVQRDITERKRIEARFRRLVDSNAQGVIFWNTKGEITEANDTFLKLIRYTREDLEAGRINWMALTPPEYAHLDRRCLEEIAAHGVCAPYEKEYLRKDGSRVPILLGAAAFEDNPNEGVCFFLDLTDRKRLEAQLVQSQKMETVGKLAGGIAHEFNSIMTAIIGQSELLLHDLAPENPLRKNAMEIRQAAERATSLTRQLLAYGRKQILQPEVLDLNFILGGMESTLRHLMGRSTDVRMVPAAGLKTVKADVAQIEQVIMNMAMNAADAMPNGGKLMLETANVTFDDQSVGRYLELKPGDYVMLAITDTGIGMSAEIKGRIFEPFFTTKSVGQGTGLGLSTCYGIIKQSGGHISVYTEPGRGTTFKIYLPQVEQLPKAILRVDSPALPRGMETILLVEDDPALREMAATLLRRLGYTVLAAANGVEALSLKQQREVGHIDLVFTDVVMPHMSGKELADRVRVLYPHTRILFTSAYTENAIVHQGVLNEGVALLQKPFTPSALAQKLRSVLDQPGVPKPDSTQDTFGFTELPRH